MMDAEQKKERIAAMSRTVLSWCRARTANMEEAQDLRQDILAEMLRSAADLRSDDAFYGFMWRVAGNVYRAYLRKRAREILPLREEALEDVPDTPEEDASEELCLLRRELGLLEEKYRRAMVLYYLDGLRCAEIAVRLSISESMVKYLLFAARKIVKDGMHMERNYGQLSYNPRALTPMYSGEGPNRFWDFMQSRIRQNIFCACWSDTPTQQEISLEIGIPLPYLEQDIDAMTRYGILERQGSRYRAGIGLVSADCIREIRRSWEQEVGELAGRIEDFGAENAVGGSASRRWTLWAMLYRCMMRLEGVGRDDAPEAPVTGWGEHAWLYLQEEAGLPVLVVEDAARLLHPRLGGDGRLAEDEAAQPRRARDRGEVGRVRGALDLQPERVEAHGVARRHVAPGGAQRLDVLHGHLADHRPIPSRRGSTSASRCTSGSPRRGSSSQAAT